MIEVIVWETTDSQLYKTENEAREHQDELDKKERVEAFMLKHGFDGMDRYDMVLLLLEHGHEIGITTAKGEQ